MARTPVVVSWSGGKDSAMALHALRTGAEYDVVGLLTTVTADYDRVSIHGIRREILRAQAGALGLPLIEAPIAANAENAAYEAAFVSALDACELFAGAPRTIAFGDLFLADVRAYRERLLAATAWQPVFPLWGEPTTAFARRTVASGVRAILCCVDTEQLDARFAGREYDAALLDELPDSVDPAGERGEFHTCVYASPDFGGSLAIELGERVRRDARFEYCDLMLDTDA